MSIPIDPAYIRCPRIGHGVSAGQTEGQCREFHHCSDEACPLEKQLGQNRFSRALHVLSASIGQGWTDGRG